MNDLDLLICSSVAFFLGNLQCHFPGTILFPSAFPHSEHNGRSWYRSNPATYFKLFLNQNVVRAVLSTHPHLAHINAGIIILVFDFFLPDAELDASGHAPFVAYFRRISFAPNHGTDICALLDGRIAAIIGIGHVFGI